MAIRARAASRRSRDHHNSPTDAAHAVARFTDEAQSTDRPLVCLDRAGRIIVGNDSARTLLGLPEHQPWVAPGERRPLDVTRLPTVLKWATGRSLAHPHRRGFAHLDVRPDGPTTPVCHLSPDHGLVAEAVRAADDATRRDGARLAPRPHPGRTT